METDAKGLQSTVVRMVVTGHDADGRAAFVHDGEPESARTPALADYVVHDIWGSEGAPVLPAPDQIPASERFFPPPGGLHVVVSTILPDVARSDPETWAATVEARRARWPRQDAGLYQDPADPRMHLTDTVDIALILFGEVVLELEGGASTRLHAGDFVVQNGTAHAWSNDTSTPCRILFVLCGARNPAAPAS
jgi:uncharacterized cupin superfamily protein